MVQKTRNLQVIGRLENVDFPDWELYDIAAKVDTGAFTSSLHCHHIEAYSEGGTSMVKFNLLDPSHETYNEKLFRLPIYKTKKIKSSNGITEERILIKANIRIFNKIFQVELSLTDRSEMKYPVLIGRKLLKNRFLVDSSQKFVSKNL